MSQEMTALLLAACSGALDPLPRAEARPNVLPKEQKTTSRTYRFSQSPFVRPLRLCKVARGGQLRDPNVRLGSTAVLVLV